MGYASDLTVLPIPKLIRRLAVPASIGMFFNTMFNVVDTYFAGLISTQALAALSLSLPVFFIIIATGSGIATGTTSLIANAFGAGNRAEAKLMASQGITFGVLSAAMVCGVGIAASPSLFRLLGAADVYLADCLMYMNVIFGGTVFFILAYMCNAILTAQGDTRSFMLFLIAGSLLNVIFDPWFIYGGFGVPVMGIAGVAVATVLIQFVGACFLGYRVYRTGIIAREDLQDMIPRWKPMREIARQGFPATMTLLTVALGFFIITFFVSTFGKEAVAAYGISIRIEQIALLPTIGLNVATLTIVAQNNGARLFHRVTEALSCALTYGMTLMAAGTVLLFAGAPALIGFFTADETVIAIGTMYLRIAAFVLYAYVILYVNVAALQGVKKPLFAVWIGLARQIAAPALVFYSFIHILNWGIGGIWWGIFMINWCAAAVTYAYTRRTLRAITREGAGG